MKTWGFHHCSEKLWMRNANGSPRPGFWFSISAELPQICSSQERFGSFSENQRFPLFIRVSLLCALRRFFSQILASVPAPRLRDRSTALLARIAIAAFFIFSTATSLLPSPVLKGKSFSLIENHRSVIYRFYVTHFHIPLLFTDSHRTAEVCDSITCSSS